jgi:hypothetical protein
MKSNFFKSSYVAVNTAFALILIITTNCQKAETTPGKGTKTDQSKVACLITRIEKDADNYSTFQYDANNRLTSFFESTKPQSTIISSNSTIERDQQNRIARIVGALQGGFSIRDVFYDEKGRWIRTNFSGSTDATSGKPLAALIPEYNEQGLISKLVEGSTPGSYLYNHTYEYSNGDPIKSKRFSSNYTYEYDMNKEVEVSDIDLMHLYRNGATSPVGYISSGTPPAKHLIKKITSSGNSVVEYSYEFNQQGYPMKVIVDSHYNNNHKTEIYTISYECK